MSHGRPTRLFSLSSDMLCQKIMRSSGKKHLLCWLDLGFPIPVYKEAKKEFEGVMIVRANLYDTHEMVKWADWARLADICNCWNGAAIDLSYNIYNLQDELMKLGNKDEQDKKEE